MATFKAVVVEKGESGVTAALKDFPESDLMDGDVTVRVEWSTINYKDGLSITGKAPIARRWPMIAGIDLAGRVESSTDPNWKAGDAVILNGFGLGEMHLGAYAEKVRVKGEWLIPLPQGLSGREAMAIGTAGYTAMLAVLTLEKHGLTPQQGPVLVTGAAGGVGSVAIALLAKAGYTVVASTGRREESDYLTGLGASEIIDRKELEGPVKALAKERWAAGIDSVGSVPLANMLSMIKARGAVAACGNAAGLDLPTSVAPFILRGIALFGIDSVYRPIAERTAAWARLSRDLDRDRLNAMTKEIPLADIFEGARRIVAGQVRGRTVVKIG